MTFDFKYYVPSLKWRQAEYQALSRLSAHAKSKVVPLLTIPKIEFDFESQTPKHTIDEHLRPFTKRLLSKWKGLPAWLDFDPTLWASVMSDGTDVFSHTYKSLLAIEVGIIPVICPDSNPAAVSAVAAFAKARGTGVGVRVNLQQLTGPGCSATIGSLLASMGVTASETDLLIDLIAPKYEPLALFASALTGAMATLTMLGTFRSITVVGTAFPDSMTDVKPPGSTLPRLEWDFYKQLHAVLVASNMPKATFGDYTTVAPSFAADFDMRFVKPAGKLVYTSSTSWIVRKGGSFRDNPARMQSHCADILASGIFRGGTFSDGDDYIEKCAGGLVGFSGLTRWKEISISHHIMQVLDDLASFHASAASPALAFATA